MSDIICVECLNPFHDDYDEVRCGLTGKVIIHNPPLNAGEEMGDVPLWCPLNDDEKRELKQNDSNESKEVKDKIWELERRINFLDDINLHLIQNYIYKDYLIDYDNLIGKSEIIYKLLKSHGYSLERNDDSIVVKIYEDD